MSEVSKDQSGGVVLSVLIACRDAGQTLGEQLAALADQACPVPWELLICDNGSVDDTVAVALSFEDRLPLRLVNAADGRGAAAARNAGAAVAQGQWLAFADADDVAAGDWLREVCLAMQEEQFVAGRFEVTRLNTPRVRRSRTLEQDDALQRGPSGLAHAGAGNMAVHQDVFAAVGGFDTSLEILEDTDLCWRIQRRGVPLVFRPTMLMHVRLRSTWRGMYRQGFSYGSAYAELQRREAALLSAGQLAAAESVQNVKVFPKKRRENAVKVRLVRLRHQIQAVIRAWLGQPPDLGHLIWQVGWHRGFGQV